MGAASRLVRVRAMAPKVRALGFTENVGGGATRGHPMRVSGITTAGTPWNYSARYSKDPGDGETDEDYNLTFGGITFYYSCFNHSRVHTGVSGRGIDIATDDRGRTIGRDPRLEADLMPLAQALTTLAEKEGMPLKQFAEELARGTYCHAHIIGECVKQATNRRKLAVSLCTCVRVALGVERWKARAADRAYAPGGAGYHVARSNFDQAAVSAQLSEAVAVV